MTPSALRQYQRYLLYALVALLPLIITPDGRDVFRLGKEVFAQILALSLISLAGAELVLRETAPRLPRILLASVAAFCLWSATSAFWASVPSLALYALFNLVLFSLFTLSLTLLLEPRSIRFLILLNLVPASLTAIYTVVQYFGLDPLFITPEGRALLGRENAGGLVGDVNTAGCYLAISLMLSMNSILLEQSPLRRTLAVIGCAAVTTGLLFTQTLTAIGATATASVVLAALDAYLITAGSSSKRRPWTVLLCLFLAAGMAAALFAVGNEQFRQRLLTRYHDLRTGDWARLTSYRAPMFAVTWRMALERPWLGHGLHSFETDFYAAKVRHRPGQLISMPGSIESTPRQAHNEYLQVWAELGGVGLALLLATLGGVLYLGLRGLSVLPEAESRYLMAAGISAFVTALVSGLAFFPAHLALTAVWIAIPSSVILSLYNQSPKVPEDELRRMHSRKSSNRVKPTAEASRRGGTRAAYVPIAISFVGGYLLLSPLPANERINQATTLIERVMRGEEPNSRIYMERSLSLLDQARRQNPLEPQVYQSAGTAYWYLYQFDRALENFVRAALLDPTPEAFTNLGEAYRGMGELELAERAFDSALAYNPEFDKAKGAKELVIKLKTSKTSN